MENLTLFIPITKVDEDKRLVYGTVAEEIPDHAGEVFDYKTSKPNFEKWSGEFEKQTDGKSLGNVRAMHGAVAAGKLTDITFEDEAKKIEAVAKIVDDGEWEKVKEGVYTGFSIGGRYEKRWPDGIYMRYTAKPNEVSLVDKPCIPTATFSMIKADGTTEARAFKFDLAKWAGEEIGDVASAVYALQSIVYLWQKEVTEDHPEAKEQAAALKAVIDKLKTFISSEIKEETLTQEEMAMMDKIEALRKAVAEITDELVKGHSKETLTKIQGIHDHACGLGAKCDTTKADEAGAEALKKIEAEKTDALSKVEALTKENGDLKKQVEDLTKKAADLKAELDKKPEPPKGATKAIGKADDAPVVDKTEEMKKKAEADKDPAAMIKLLHSEPRVLG